jgi:hypothetical protein
VYERKMEREMETIEGEMNETKERKGVKERNKESQRQKDEVLIDTIRDYNILVQITGMVTD